VALVKKLVIIFCNVYLCTFTWCIWWPCYSMCHHESRVNTRIKNWWSILFTTNF